MEQETIGKLSSPERASSELLALIQNSLEDDKAEDVVTIDLARKSSIADYMVIASGRSQRQVGAISQHLAERVKAEGFGPARMEGNNACDWVLVDTGDVIVHVFRPEVRSFYNLEKLWSVVMPEEAAAV
jgi:ribosome-associated protein